MSFFKLSWFFKLKSAKFLSPVSKNLSKKLFIRRFCLLSEKKRLKTHFGLIGYQLASVSNLATLPVSCLILGNFLGAIIVSHIMNKTGRKKGIIFASFFEGLMALAAAGFSLWKSSF